MIAQSNHRGQFDHFTPQLILVSNLKTSRLLGRDGGSSYLETHIRLAIVLDVCWLT